MDRAELQSTLSRKLGAAEDRKNHHVFYFLEVNGREHRVAKFSHSSRGQLPAFVVSDTAKRLKLSGPELNDLVDCSLTEEGFLALWSAR